jgi:hypothetical protein
LRLGALMAWARSSVAVGVNRTSAGDPPNNQLAEPGLPHGGPDRPVDALNGESGLIVPLKDKSRL